jgi:hypothetical protein
MEAISLGIVGGLLAVGMVALLIHVLNKGGWAR